MKKVSLRRLPCILLLCVLGVQAATGQVMGLTARVDTSQQNVKEVYQLVGNYLRAKPDSLYANPYWNAAETDYYFTRRHEKADLAAPFLFFGTTARQTFSAYKPTVLSIEPTGNKYVVRVLLYAENPAAWITETKWNPPFILRYYAAKDGSGNWKLENTWANVLVSWKTHATPWITFHYPAAFNFSTARAGRASAFCDSVVAALKLTDAKPFDFYVMDSEEELGRLFNLDYWLAYHTGFTQKMYNRTLSGRGREQHLHEFAHMLYHPVSNYFLAEGIATYLGGVDGFTPYPQTLRAVSEDLTKKYPTIRFKDLYTNSFKYALNSNPRYAAGALVYELVYRKAGVNGFVELEKSENTYESLLLHFAAVMRLRLDKADAFLNSELRNYSVRTVKK
ncbi:MAG: hypothetical protein M3Y12_10740 [Bacteroidota bacterium]|nr:hypothetical protein [Bacteroidota bacterium]